MNWINEIYKIFQTVQESEIFEDQKFFADCSPRTSLDEIREGFENTIKDKASIKSFVETHFEYPEAIKQDHIETVGILEHIENLWSLLTVENSKDKGSLIGVPAPYVKPGGRFREYYYWDSYFTMLGLKVAGKNDLVRSMVQNFSFLIKKFGFIPNGTRTYFLSRSQPPFYGLMVDLLAQIQGDQVLIDNMEYLELEYQFWMKGAENLKEKGVAERVVSLGGGVIANRYFDNENKPRPESYLEDASMPGAKTKENLFTDLRAACESGWDFSSRWLKDTQDLDTIYASKILPIDLNCLLYFLEDLLGKCYRLKENGKEANQYFKKAADRKSMINQYFWNKEKEMYFDYDLEAVQSTPSISLAALFPLFFKIASQDQADKTLKLIEEVCLKDGGLITTPIVSGQQWDAPNAWAPLQYIGYAAAKNYGNDQLAESIKNSWMKNVERVFNNTGKLMEKYNAVDTTTLAGGGEYPNQDGFGWTNGVYLFFAHE